MILPILKVSMMVDDTARKVLRVLYNSYREAWARIDYARLQYLSGRTRRQIERALQELEEHGYIERRDGLTRVIEGWERQPAPERHWWGS